MTDPEGTENVQLNPESASEDTTTGVNEKQAEELAAADYQTRLEEFEKVDTTPLVSSPAPGKPGPVEMPKPE